MTDQPHPQPVREQRFKYTPLSRIFLSRHYRLREFCQHDLALYFGIRNVPSELGLARGRLLAQRLLEPLHAEFGELRILQGFVSAALNAKRMAMGAVASPTSLHMWDRAPHLGLHLGVACDFCLRGREGDLAAQRILVEFLGQSQLPWHNVLLFPNTSSVHLVHHPQQAAGYVNLRLEFVDPDTGQPRSKYYRLRDYRHTPWHLLHLSTVASVAEAEAWLRAHHELR